MEECFVVEFLHPIKFTTTILSVVLWFIFRHVRKTAKATISFVISVRLSFCPHGTTWHHLDGFA